jgi:hypothetical protein
LLFSEAHEGHLKKINGNSDLAATLQSTVPGNHITRRLTCRSRLRRGLSTTTKTSRPVRTSPDAAEDVVLRLQPGEIEPATRRDATEQDLCWLEEEVGGPLPPDYRTFLGGYGWTGFAPAMRFPMVEAAPFGAWAEVSSFLGFSSEIRRDLAFLVSDVYAGQLPEATMPIASDGDGNLVLLSVVGPNKGRVWFWDRECRGLDRTIDAMVADLEAQGQSTIDFDENEIMRRWELLFPERRTKPYGFGNVYLAAESFVAFLESLS